MLIYRKFCFLLPVNLSIILIPEKIYKQNTIDWTKVVFIIICFKCFLYIFKKKSHVTDYQTTKSKQQIN